MRDPRRRLWAFLDGRPFLDDAVVTSAFLFGVGWPLFALSGLSSWSVDDGLTFALVYALPTGAFSAYRRRRRAADRS